MSTLAENSLWYKGKGEILREFGKNRGAILSAVASRNFSGMPGFAIEALTDVEIDSKFKLTEINFKILAEAIDREFRQLGLENDIALKQATMAWELEKIGLLTEMQKGFADEETIRTLDAERIDSLMIAQEVREIAIQYLKLNLEILIEQKKREIENLDLLTLPYETRLATAELATARRKLAVIAPMQRAMQAQREALDMEAAYILPAREEKANYEMEVADKTTTIILPKMADKANATLALTSAQETLLQPMMDKADKTNEYTAVMGTLLPKMEEKAEAGRDLVERERDLIPLMIQKADAINILSAREGDILPPLQLKTQRIGELRDKQIDELLPLMATKADKTVSLVEREGTLIAPGGPMERKSERITTLANDMRTLFDGTVEKAENQAALAAEENTLLPYMEDKTEATTDLTTAQGVLTAPGGVLQTKALKTVELTAAEAELIEPDGAMFRKIAAVEDVTEAQVALVAPGGPMDLKLDAMTDLVTAEDDLLTPMTEKVAAMDALVAAQGGLLDPMQRKIAATTDLTDELGTLTQPQLDKQAAMIALTGELGNLIPPMQEKLAATQDLLDAQAALDGPIRLRGEAYDQELIAQGALSRDGGPMDQKASAASDLLNLMIGTLLTPLQEKAVALMALAAEMGAQYPNYQLLAAEKIVRAGYIVDRRHVEHQVFDKEVALDEEKVSSDEARALVEETRANHRKTLADALDAQFEAIKTAVIDAMAKEQTYRVNKALYDEEVKLDYMDTVETARFNLEKRRIAEEVREVNENATNDKQHQTEMVSATKDIKMTETLIHLLS